MVYKTFGIIHTWRTESRPETNRQKPRSSSSSCGRDMWRDRSSKILQPLEPEAHAGAPSETDDACREHARDLCAMDVRECKSWGTIVVSYKLQAVFMQKSQLHQGNDTALDMDWCRGQHHQLLEVKPLRCVQESHFIDRLLKDQQRNILLLIDRVFYTLMFRKFESVISRHQSNILLTRLQDFGGPIK